MIVASNNITLSNVNDGNTPYVHIAYANSADGTDGFYIGGGGTNLLLNTQSFDKNWTWENIGHSFANGILTLSSTNNGRMYQALSSGNPNGRTFSLSFYAKISADCDSQSVQVKVVPYDANNLINITSKDFQLYKVENWQWTSQSGNLSFYVINGKVDISNLKLEYGPVATPWCPAPSEMNPTYMGAYTDYTQSASLDPTAYHWSLIKGADGKDGAPGIPGAPGKDGQTTYFHIAYANSADGSVGFTNTPGNNSYDYFGTYTDYTLTSSTDPTKYTWVKMFDSSKKRNFTTTPTTPYDVGDTWITSGSTYFCKTARSSGAFNQSDWVLQQLTIQSLDDDLQASINGDKNLLMVDDVTYYSSSVLDLFNTSTGSNSGNGVGTNLYTDTQNFNNLSSWWGSGKWTKITDTYNGLAVMQTTDPWNGLSQYIPVKKGDVLTYSVYARYTSGTGTSTIYWQLNSQTEGSYNNAITNLGSNTVTLTDSWQRVSSTIVVNSDGYLRPRLERTYSNNTLQIAGIKVEKGSVATPWSPSPEDVCYPFDYTSTDTNYVFQVQAKSTVSGDYVHMYPAWGNTYGQSQDKTTQVSVATSPSIPNQTSTFNSANSDTKLLLTTDWVTYTCTISGTWDKGSVLTALLGQVYNSETKGTVSFRKIKLVAGNAIKDYTSDDSITVAQGSNYWDLTTLQNNIGGGVNLVSGTAQDIVVDDTANTGTQGWRRNTIPINDDLKVGDKITVSVENVTMTGKGDLSQWGAILYSTDISEARSGIYAINSGKNGQVTITVSSIKDPNKQTALLIYSGRVGDTEGKKAVFHHLKVERGSTATPWSPNPSDSGYASWLQTQHYTPWYPISEGQRVFLTHYDYPSYPGTTTSAIVEFADSDHNFISNGTNNSQGSSTLDGTNSKFINPQSLGGVYYNERMLNISIVSEAWTSGTYQDLYIQTSGLLQSKLAVSGRGTTVATFDPYSGQRVDTQYWDTYATVDNANALVNYLNSIANQDLVVAIATRDSFIQDSNDFQIASQNLCTVLQSMGLPSSYAPADLRGQVSFAFVGHTPAYQGITNESLVSSSKGDGQVSTLTAYVSNGHISSTNTTRLVAYANAPAKTAYFRAGYSFSPDEINRVHFMVTVDKLSTNYSSNIADVSSNAVRKDVSYKGVTLNENGLTATAGDTQVIVNSSNGFEIKKSGVDVFSVDTNGNLTITGSTISTGNISGVDFSGQDLTLSGTLSVNGSIVAANGSFTIDQNGMEVSPQGGGSVVISKGGLTIQGSSVGSQSTAGTYGSNDSLAGDAGLFATKDSSGNTKTWITSSGTLIAQDAVIHGNVSVDNLTLTSSNSKIMFGSGFQIDGSGEMTVTANSNISNGTYSNGVIEGSELDIGTAYHSKLSDSDKYRYHVSNIGETTFGMSQDLDLMSSTQGINESYLNLDNAWTQGQVNFNGTGSAPNNAVRALGITSDIYADSYGWNHRFSAPVNGVSDTRNYIPIWDKDNQGSINQYTINYNITDPITKAVNTQVGSTGWGGSDTSLWTLSTVEFPRLLGSLFTFGSNSDLYPTQNQTIKLSAGTTYVFGAYIWHCGLHNGAKVTIMTSSSDSSLQNTNYYWGNTVGYQQSGYSLVAYTPSSNVYLHSVYVEVASTGGNQGDNYGVPISVTDPFAVPLNQFTSKLFGGKLDALTSLGGHFGMPYPHLDASQHGVLGLMRADNLTAGDKVVVSVPINYKSGTMDNYPQIKLGIAKPGNDDNYIELDGEFQPLMPGYYTYDFYFVWQDEYKNYINSNMIQLNLISKGIGSGEKAYVVSVDSVRMGIFVGQTTTSSTQNVNEYQTKFSPLGSLQLSHISNVWLNGYTIVGHTQLTSEGLEINSSFSTSGFDSGGMHISINGKSGISIGGNMSFGNAQAQPALSFYGSVPYDTLLEHTIEPQYNVNWDESNSASGIWFDSYGNAHGYGSSLYWHVQSPSEKSNLAVPLADGNEFGFALSDSNGNSGSNILRIGLVHFNKFGGGYIGGNYPAIISGSGDSLSGIAFCGGFVIIFGNGNKTNNLWSFPRGTSDGHMSDSGSIDEVTSQNNM